MESEILQSPSFLTLSEGKATFLHCILRTQTTDIMELTFTWTVGSSKVICALEASFSTSCQDENSDPRFSIAAHLANKSSILTITRASLNHIGAYRCQAQIFKPYPIKTLTGNGSVVLVQEIGHQSPRSLALLFAVATSVLLLVFIVACLSYILVLKWNKGTPQDKTLRREAQNLGAASPDDQYSTEIVYLLVHTPVSHHQSEESAYTEINLAELGREQSQDN
ncbi:uncharacterized protein LOC125487821 [Rhincodon typus]|uniref:uncharacterized protein LOC125487821 n=1 Tax=Rhincodon typus TaxID=259920 RepID=UPI0020307C4F|nr:uncharacterized protein LOC125487821 [Rhincodon typus]